MYILIVLFAGSLWIEILFYLYAFLQLQTLLTIHQFSDQFHLLFFLLNEQNIKFGAQSSFFDLSRVLLADTRHDQKTLLKMDVPSMQQILHLGLIILKSFGKWWSFQIRFGQ